MSFGSGVGGYANKTKKNINLGVTKVNIDLVTSTIKGTPVKEGTARGNWFPSLDTPSSEIQDGRKEAEALSDAIKEANRSAGKVFYLTNNLPYIRPLEYGWSKQAPNGMVRIAIVNANSALRKFKTTK